MEPGDLERFATGPVAYVFAFVLGALWGSFANVAILRVPAGQSVVRPASRCGSCGTPIRWYDNVPIVSWLVLRGRCRSCGVGFSPRYMLVEAATGLLFAATWHLCTTLLHPSDPLGVRVQRFGTYALFELTMVVITFIDLDHKKIPDRITYPAIPVFLGLGLLLQDRPWWDHVIGVVAGYGVVRLIADGFYLLTKKEGMGYGDGKLLAIIGGLFGWRAVAFSLFGGSLIGSAVSVVVMIVTRRSLRGVEIPFGPYLVAAALVYLFLQRELTIAFSALWPA